MVFGNRFIKIIVLTLGIYLLTANVILWATEPSVNLQLIYSNFTTHNLNEFSGFKGFHDFGMVNFKGFKWFFDRISTFPGPTFTHGVLTTYTDILSGFSITGNWGLDFLLAIFRITSTPILLSITIVVDIVNNGLWFVKFVVWQ